MNSKVIPKLKGTLTSELTQINGIGQNTFEKLMQHFKSVKKIKDATENELTALIGTARAHRLLNYFREQREKENSQDANASQNL